MYECNCENGVCTIKGNSGPVECEELIYLTCEDDLSIVREICTTQQGKI